MKKHFLYLKYLLRHKWYVAIECFKQGLWVHAFTHDLSKFRPSEWFPYAEFFYGEQLKSKMGKVSSDFDYAWLLHQKRNKHHWQYWVLMRDSKPTKLLEIPDKHLITMACDWIGASKAIRGKDAKPMEWYQKVKKQTLLSELTRTRFEKLLNINR